MVDKKKLVISYCCIFLSIYLLSIAYASFSFYLEEQHSISTPQPEMINATTMALSSIPSWGGIFAILLTVAIIFVVLFLILNGTRAMGTAFN